ncbi:hypothetical protein QAD02_007523 [Eretmocerus hayati]|uniref:Uncharacterized protein n=1 Tax=Eretmocerus hayati TaxID=131215 RepID=A0ACC2N585_9HYME|nr:hypothetical protein QAD02_007523 [Eretmocerus hayati]
MNHSICCVVNCKNNGRNSKCMFFSFPSSKLKSAQRLLWIAAVKRKNDDGSPRVPKPHDKICSDHFVGKDRSFDERSPSYVPTIFPSVYHARKVNTKSAAERYKRVVNRCNKNMMTSAAICKKSHVVETNIDDNNHNFTQNTGESSSDYMVCDNPVKLMVDQGCQVRTFEVNEPLTSSSSFYIYRSDAGSQSHCEIQTDIIISNKKGLVTKKMVDNENCSTFQKVMNDQCVGTDPNVASEFEIQLGFRGVKSIKNERQLLDLAGVSTSTFNLLLSRTEHLKSGNWKIERQNRLLFGNTRVIIDCTEFRIEIPSKLDDRVWCYSHYKHGFTIKLLVCITPGGYICFKSRAAGGRKSDSQLTIESGLLDLLEEGDVVLADKGFPDIKTVIDASGKKVLVVMPPFLSDKKEFTKQETEDTYNIASVRIHVERIMQRLRVYKILDKIPRNLFPHIDDIIQMCCVLVNLQPPIFSDENSEESN